MSIDEHDLVVVGTGMGETVVEEAQYVTLVDGFVPVPGPPGGVTIKGELDSVDDLPTTGNVVNDGWMVDGHLWVWSETGEWLDAGSIQGPQGEQGPQGPTGSQGIQGEPGPPGATGSTGGTGPAGPAGSQGIQGVQGVTGTPGATGSQGPAGPAGGGTVADLWGWLAAATSSTVGATRVGVNHDSPASATFMWVHKESQNANIDYSTTIAAMVAGDHVYLQAKANAASFHRYTVTGAPALQGGTTWRIPIVTDSGSPSGTEPTNGADVLVAFQFQPLQGPPGPAGPTGSQGIQGIQGIQGPAGTAGATGPTGATGSTGPEGPQGPEGGTPIIPHAYADWPPVAPVADTLYLRLAP